MSSTNNAVVMDLFKESYGELENLLPEDEVLAKDIPFDQATKVGDKYVQAVVLTRETGITLTNSTDAVELNPAIAGVVRQAEVTPFISVLPSILPWGVVSRSAGAGKAAFFEATKHLVRNNLKSHSAIQEVLRFYGQSPDMLGTVSYASQTYRGFAFVNGTGTVDGITFTNGVDVLGKRILFAPGQFAAGIFTAFEGIKINQVDAVGNIVGSGKLVGCNTSYGYITVDFVPVPATSVGSHRICWDGMESGTKEYAGVHKILSGGAGTLFGIPTNQYSLWQGNKVDLGQTKLTFGKFGGIMADVVNRGGLQGDTVAYVNPRTWASIIGTEADKRVYDSSYRAGGAEQGFDNIKFHTNSGTTTFKSHRMVKEGDAFILHLSDWMRAGSAEISFSVPGMPGEIIFPLSNQTAWGYRSYSDQFLFCHMPANSLYISGIDDESSS